jgi:hypothetical protein
LAGMTNERPGRRAGGPAISYAARPCVLSLRSRFPSRCVCFNCYPRRSKPRHTVRIVCRIHIKHKTQRRERIRPLFLVLNCAVGALLDGFRGGGVGAGVGRGGGADTGKDEDGEGEGEGEGVAPCNGAGDVHVHVIATGFSNGRFLTSLLLGLIPSAAGGRSRPPRPPHVPRGSFSLPEGGRVRQDDQLLPMEQRGPLLGQPIPRDRHGQGVDGGRFPSSQVVDEQPRWRQRRRWWREEARLNHLLFCVCVFGIPPPHVCDWSRMEIVEWQGKETDAERRICRDRIRDELMLSKRRMCYGRKSTFGE